MSKKGKKALFPRLAVFFFPKILRNILFFFPGKVYTALTHSISKAGKKKTGPEKKQLFHSFTQFLPKSPEKQTFAGKKEYGTFGLKSFFSGFKGVIFGH